jgi:hypothetical protein
MCSKKLPYAIAKDSHYILEHEDKWKRKEEK